MEFELKNVEAIGGVKAKDNNNSIQMLNITVGVAGCTYPDIIANQLVEYSFSNSMSVQAAKDGIGAFAMAWVAETYPTI